jgi:hypothetical protein
MRNLGKLFVLAFAAISGFAFYWVVARATLTLDFSWQQLALNSVLWFAGMTAIAAGALLTWAWCLHPGKEETALQRFYNLL